MRRFIKLLEAAGVSYRVVSHMDAEFPPHSPVSRLTEKQRRPLVTAYTPGYYDVPKKIGLVQLAERLDGCTIAATMHKACKKYNKVEF